MERVKLLDMTNIKWVEENIDIYRFGFEEKSDEKRVVFSSESYLGEGIFDYSCILDFLKDKTITIRLCRDRNHPSSLSGIYCSGKFDFSYSKCVKITPEKKSGKSEEPKPQDLESTVKSEFLLKEVFKTFYIEETPITKALESFQYVLPKNMEYHCLCIFETIILRYKFGEAKGNFKKILDIMGLKSEKETEEEMAILICKGFISLIYQEI